MLSFRLIFDPAWEAYSAPDPSRKNVAGCRPTNVVITQISHSTLFSPEKAYNFNAPHSEKSWIRPWLEVHPQNSEARYIPDLDTFLVNITKYVRFRNR